jgi:hypothetical protein
VAEERVDFGYDTLGRPTAFHSYSDLSATNVVAATTFAYDQTSRLTT